ncbi:MAG: BrnT family toxin [Oligoflexales bacterium]|nr:BrnT family toxin [Oligoflexales bacterium]
MEVVYDSIIELWLAETWDLTLDWDEANTEKLGKHATTVDQVESLFDSNFILGGKIIPPATTAWNEDRFIIFGQTRDGTRLTIVWTIRENKIRPISCRRMRSNESKNYQKRIT